MGWEFKVGKKWQITIQKLAPVLGIKPGDYVVVEESVWKGKLVISKKDGGVPVRKKET